VLEELEPLVERSVCIEAQLTGFRGRIVGKLQGPLQRSGEYGVREIVEGVCAACDLEMPEAFLRRADDAVKLAAARPITVCAGCPHRGTFMAINDAIRRAGYKKGQVLVTGDIGCTILGMNPPFETVWTEVSMGASLGLAQGYLHAGLESPVIATIGDSTLFHAGLPPLINAIQHGVPLTLVIMDNGWTAMTGMQVNPGTDVARQPAGGARVDLAELIPALGIEHSFHIDPYELEEATATLTRALGLPGVKVVLARRECAIQAARQGKRAGTITVAAENCTLCKVCLVRTGCPALQFGAESVGIDHSLCGGCGLCAQVCPNDALHWERAA
jgi:indolepyruvate ferredoxin oxidoreductase alpha subunit